MTLEALLEKLQGVRRNGSTWKALCPAHADKNPSLAINVREQMILLFCHAGCTQKAVMAALGIEPSDLFLGADDIERRIVAIYDYPDEQGKLLYQNVRFHPKDFRLRRPDGKDGWTWNLDGIRRVPYNLPAIIAADFVSIVEGEKDADSGTRLGFATTSSKHWRSEFCDYLRGKHVVVIADADDAGRKTARDVANSLLGKVSSLKLFELPGSAKDLTEWVEGGGTRDALEGFIESQPEWKQGPSASASAITRAFSDIKPELLRWLWPSRIPVGKVTLLIGDPGLGKSLLTIEIASRVSRGASFPDGAKCELGAVVMASAEDDPADTIRPRLDAANADVSLIHTLEGVRTTLNDGSNREQQFHLGSGIAALEDLLVRISNARLIIIDPISAFLGNTDGKANAEVRGLLSPLATLAARHRVAILCVTHLRKSAGTAIHRSIDSIAFTAAARASWAVASDPSDPERRLMLPVKQNLGPDTGGLAFRIVTETGLPHLVWETGAVALTANDVLGSMEGRETQDALHEAESWLSELLASGPVPVPQIQAEAEAAGLSWATVRRAKSALSIVAKKSTYDGGWEWRFKDVHLEGAQPEPHKNERLRQGG
jgi:putative DNA primase/helicase